MNFTLEQNRLNVAKKQRSNIFTWRGQFTPQLVDYLLDRLSAPDSVVIDPFCGSGTVLLESAQRGLASAGIELNPAAYAMAKFSTLASLSSQERTMLIRQVESYMHRCFRDFGDRPLWGVSGNYREKASHLLEFGRAVLDLCETKQQTLIAALTLFEADGLRNGDLIPAIQTSFDKILQRINQLPVVDFAPRVFLCDARLAHTVVKDQCDLLITSPPYINVFNYHQNHRAIVEILGFDVLRVARSEIGSNRKNRQNRFRTVVQYAIEMERCLASWAQTMSSNAKLVLVLGRESNVRGIPFMNGAIVADIAAQGRLFSRHSLHERTFTNRFGKTIYEDILIFEKIDGGYGSGAGRSVAALHLESALQRDAAEDVLQDIRDTLDVLDEIPESPLFERMPII